MPRAYGWKAALSMLFVAGVAGFAGYELYTAVFHGYVTTRSGRMLTYEKAGSLYIVYVAFFAVAFVATAGIALEFALWKFDKILTARAQRHWPYPGPERPPDR